MPIRRSPTFRWHYAEATLSWRGFSHYFSPLIFIVCSITLLVLSQAQPEAVMSLRAHVTDALTPFFNVVARGASAVEEVGTTLRDLVSLRSENEKLRQENRRMVEWKNTVVLLQKENAELKSLLHFKTEPSLSYISARVIADSGNAYTRGLILTAGKSDGVREGMAAMTGDGLIGRVIEVGTWSSRIWLISDLNSRIPVTIAETGDRAILAGDNTEMPKLLFLARDAMVFEGAHVVTSGHGGVFAPNLPIGTLKETERGAYRIVPSADLSRVNYIRLVDFNLEGGPLNSMSKKHSVRSGR
ncbi:MAG: rod shape-determining protein MreC [Alphaproteobacteria bacterium]|nr:rod shape-determining protein MreC [Alphaproteobacteria bacterium]